MPYPAFKDIEFVSQAGLPVTGVGFGFDSIGEARDNEVSSHFKSLNGEWDFIYFDTLDKLPEGIELIKDYRGSKTITVPSDWQIFQEDNNWIEHRFEKYREEITPPDEINSVGVYHRTFTTTTEMMERELYLQLDGVGSAAEIYLNGCYIGYCQSAYDGHRFCLADFACLGENHLTIVVYRYSHGSCLEDIGRHRLSGIFRSVWLCGEPIFGITNVVVKPSVTEDYSLGCLHIDASLSIKTKHENIELWGILYNSSGSILSKDQETVFNVAPTEIPLQLSLTINLQNPNLWSDENPCLYKLVMFMQDNLGNTLDLRAVQVGFREVAVEETTGALTINGKAVKLFGTAYEEWDADSTRTLTDEQLRKDLQLIKRCNFNAITLNHPASDKLYDICDEIGLYVLSFPAIDTYGLKKNPKITPFVRERLISTVTRLKNHPSVILWGVDDEFDPELVRLIKESDETRPIVGADISVSTETSIKSINKSSKKRPSQSTILYDFIDAEGNGMGYLSEYVNCIKLNDNLVGGFISNFIIISAWDGENYQISVADGILQPDRTPNPSAFEIKQCFSPVEMELNESLLTITNNHKFISLENYYIIWEIRLDGLTRESGQVSVPPIKVAESIQLTLPYPAISTDKAIDLVVNLYNNKPLPWSDAERSICGCYYRIKNRSVPSDNEFVALYEEYNIFSFNHANCRYTIDKQTGFLTSIMRENFEFLNQPLRPQISRVCKKQEADDKSLLNSVRRLLKMGFWQEAEKSLRLKRITAEPQLLTVDFIADGIKKLCISYRCNNKGDLIISYSVKASQPANRFGVTFEAVSELQELACFSLGPNENYKNRRKAAVPVLLQGGIEELCHHYLIPKENGNRTKAEWLMLYGNVNNDNKVLLIKAQENLPDISVHPYRKDNLVEATNLGTLTTSDCMTVNIDAANSGIGDLLRENYFAKPEANTNYEMELTIQISRS